MGFTFKNKVHDFNLGIGYFVGIVFYKISIEFMYIHVVCPLYDYRGYYLDIIWWKYFLAWILIGIIFILLPKGRNVSHLVLQMHYITMIVPFLAVYGISNQNSIFCLMLCGCFSLQLFIIKLIKKNIILPRVNFRMKYILTLILLLTAYVYFFSIQHYGIHLEVLNLRNIYTVRENAVPVTGPMAYLIIWQYRIINPLLLVYYLKSQKKFMVLVISTLQILMFLLIARKEVLFSLVLIVCLYWFLSKFNLILAGVWGLGFLSLFCSIICNIARMPVALMIRVLIDPAMIKFRHYIVFSSILPKLHFSEGKLGQLFNIPYPYDTTSGYVVSQIHNNVISNENTGYLAYAYDNGGYLAMIIMSLIFVLILIIFDNLSSNQNKYWIFAFIAYPMYLLNDGDLLTSLLSGGLLIVLFILWLDNRLFQGVHEP